MYVISVFIRLTNDFDSKQTPPKEIWVSLEDWRGETLYPVGGDEGDEKMIYSGGMDNYTTVFRSVQLDLIFVLALHNGVS